MTGLVGRLLGDVEYLLMNARASANVARALPDVDERTRRAIARRGCQLRARRRFDRWPALDDRALCRRLTLEGFENLHAARGLGRSVLWVSSDLGEPELAERVVRLYGGDESATLHLLPGAAENGRSSLTCAFLGQPIECSTGLAETALGSRAALLPIFGLFAGDGLYRAVLCPPIVPGQEDAAGLTRRILAAFEEAVRAAPEPWAWISRIQQ
jgi:lauroyl/myristoyl acyltransferase